MLFCGAPVAPGRYLVLVVVTTDGEVLKATARRALVRKARIPLESGPHFAVMVARRYAQRQVIDVHAVMAVEAAVGFSCHL